MDAEISKKNLSTSYPSSSFSAEVLSEGDAIVPDSKPDIGKILLCEAHCYPDKTELQKGRVIITGTAVFTVIYSPENEGGVKSLTAKFPFNHIAEADGILPDDKFECKLKAVHSECSLINSRKLSLKSIILLSFTSYSTLALPLCSDIKADNIELKKETVCSSCVTASAVSSFAVSDSLEIPDSKPNPEELLLCRSFVSDSTVKTVPGKAVLKGNLSVFHLYRSHDGSIDYMEHEIPFTEIADIPGLTDGAECDVSLTVGEYSSFLDDSEASSGRSCSFSCNISMSLLSFVTEAETVVTDAYIPDVKTELSFTSLKKSEITDRKKESLTVKSVAELPIDLPPMEKLCPVHSYISSESISQNDGKITVSGTVVSVIEYISENSVFSFNSDSDFSTVFDCPSGDFFTSCDIKACHTDYNFINQAKAELRCILEINLTVRENTSLLRSIDSIDISSASESVRPSMVIYFVKSGDTLWDIAKRYNTTVQKILYANSMSAEEIVNSGMRLLIPA